MLGGFLATLAEHDLDGLVEAVARQAMPASMEGLSIRTAVLAEDRLLIGAAELAFADVLRDPGIAPCAARQLPLARQSGGAVVARGNEPGRQPQVGLRRDPRRS